MNKLIFTVLMWAAIIALAGCATKPAFEPYSHKEIKHPAPLTTSTASKGQPVYLHYDYDSLITYHLQEPLNMSFMVFGKIIVSDQEILYRGMLERKEVLCTKSNTFYDMLGNAVHTSCFVDIGRAGKVDTVMTASDTTWFERPMNRTIAYTNEKELFISKAQPVKRELVFTGYADGQLTFLYREYQNDLKKAAVNQPLFVSVENFPAKKEVKGLSIEFLSATDVQVSYKILAGFQP